MLRFPPAGTILGTVALGMLVITGCQSNGVGDKCTFTRDCLKGLVCDNPTGEGGTCKKPGDVTPVVPDAAVPTPDGGMTPDMAAPDRGPTDAAPAEAAPTDSTPGER